MTDLAQKRCVPCRSGALPLKREQIKELYEQLLGGWQVVKEHHLEKEFRFKNFSQALDFVNNVGKIAEQEGHHPDIFLTWGKVGLKIWTHKANGLTENDFILAAKIGSSFDKIK